jgi:hypothetical protein
VFFWCFAVLSYLLISELICYSAVTRSNVNGAMVLMIFGGLIAISDTARIWRSRRKASEAEKFFVEMLSFLQIMGLCLLYLGSGLLISASDRIAHWVTWLVVAILTVIWYVAFRVLFYFLFFSAVRCSHFVFLVLASKLQTGVGALVWPTLCLFWAASGLPACSP